MAIVWPRKPVARHVAALVFALLSLGGCESLQNLAAPTIADATVPWTDGVERAFLADVTVPSAWQVDAVYVRYARHRWPGPAQAHEGVAEPVEGQPGRFRFVPTDGPVFRTSDSVFFQWFIDYRPAGGGIGDFVQAPQARFVVGCTQAQTDADLAADQATILAAFSTSNPHLDLPPRGYAIPTHGYTSIFGAGVAFASVPSGFSPGGVTLGAPELLLYAPRPIAAGESPAAYQAAITDVLPDPPYTLIGWAYGTVYDPANRPRLGCIPTEHWFLHEAGYHLANGDMVLTPPQESVVGAENVLVPPLALPPGAFHPRIWDLHLWARPSGTPTVSIFPPTPVPGLVLPSATFVPVATFE
jgi:hypothetical protein